MSGDPEQEYFADGIVEDIITALSHFKSLFVIACNSSFTYKGRAVDVKQVGRELGVRYVLEGSVRKAANRVRITGQLVDTATGAHLWADRFDGGLGDIFDLQDQVTESVVGASRRRWKKPRSSAPNASPPKVSTPMPFIYVVWPSFISLPDKRTTRGVAPCSVELCEASVAVNDVKRPSQSGQERDCWFPFRSERQAQPAGQEVACRL